MASTGCSYTQWVGTPAHSHPGLTTQAPRGSEMVALPLEQPLPPPVEPGPVLPVPGRGHLQTLQICADPIPVCRPLFLFMQIRCCDADPFLFMQIRPLFTQILSLFTQFLPCLCRVYPCLHRPCPCLQTLSLFTLTLTLFKSIPALFTQAPFLSAEALAVCRVPTAWDRQQA